MTKRIFDIFFSGLGLLILSPLLIIIYFLVALSSKGGAFYKQERVGLNGVKFKILKFRTMYVGSDKKGLLTVGGRDPRVTPVGYYLRKSKLDELPQLFNVFKGDMSLVGPRPEVQKYVNYYSEEDREVLTVRPGVTDYASIVFRNENEILEGASDPDAMYINKVLPIKLKLNRKYITEKGLITDFKIIFSTLFSIIGLNNPDQNDLP